MRGTIPPAASTEIARSLTRSHHARLAGPAAAERIADAVARAVEEERERAARCAEALVHGWPDAAEALVAAAGAIRAG